MRTPSCGLSALAVAGLLLASGRAAAADPVDLSRETPVPATEPIPVADFFRPPVMADPAINRAGTYFVSFLSSGQDRRDLMIYNLDKSTYERFAAPVDYEVDSYSWLDDAHIVCGLTREKRIPEGILEVSVENPADNHPILQVDPVQLVGVPERNRLRPLFWLRADAFRDGRDEGVVELNSQLHRGDLLDPNAAAGKWEQLRQDNERHILKNYPVPGEDRVVQYFADKDGELAFAITSKDGVSTLHRFTGDHWENCPVDLDSIDVIACGNQPGELVVRGPRGTGRPRPLQFMDAATGKLGEVLLTQKDHDFSGSVYREPANHLVIGAEFSAEGPQSAWFDPDYTALQKLLMQDSKLRGQVVQLLGSDVAQRRFLVAAFTDRQPVTYYVLDAQKHALELIKDSRPWIDPARMLPMSIMRYRTRDGHQFDAYVTLPRGVSKQHPAPLVVLPHDNFNARDSWGYSGEVQFLASRGYAVLQPNYRGNVGYGWQFTREEEWDFRKMSDDVTDATRALLTSGYIDPKRIGILGTGTGAYLALMGAVSEPDLYRCCVADAGVFDWAHVIKDQKYFQYDSTFYATAVRFLGDPAKEPEKFVALNPLAHLDRLKAATFVDYVKYDTIGLSESRRLISELERYQVPHETLQVGDDFHGPDYLQYKVELFERIGAFLAKYLAPGGAGTPPP
jgi:pimeloyl-ACP methyl ester carboxylesterase